ncbi:hypothetical protein [Rhizobium metallidurans]|uniref:Uncharacterized protein n=1 Tax=Rhizobium metallidurans TaxID=1265931 RepID=A0A7W6CQJ7_9HYPH|nr:hypothetical protein [Rhizobium metallidurans]MBB3962599.1 hypothetical protein [Rhizobium metallidurans]
MTAEAQSLKIVDDRPLSTMTLKYWNATTAPAFTRIGGIALWTRNDGAGRSTSRRADTANFEQ